MRKEGTSRNYSSKEKTLQEHENGSRMGTDIEQRLSLGRAARLSSVHPEWPLCLSFHTHTNLPDYQVMFMFAGTGSFF